MNLYQQTKRNALLREIRRNQVHVDLWHRARYSGNANKGTIIGGR